MTQPQPYHIPVMLRETVEGLAIRPNGTYVDLTFGGGGHTQAILSKLTPEGRLFSFDTDPDAVKNAAQITHPGFQLVKANFRFFRKHLRMLGVTEVDGILADLGISSHQIDAPDRGFSTRFEGPLDMRMNPDIAESAADVVNNYPEKELHKILGMYGEITNAKSLATAIVNARYEKPILTTTDLKNACMPLAPRAKYHQYLAQVFQGLRIQVNDELGALRDMLQEVPAALAPEGRFSIMAYHSLEDRLVKNFILRGNFHGDPQKDMFGNLLVPLVPVERKAIVASDEEISHNPRARSAKLRIAVKSRPRP